MVTVTPSFFALNASTTFWKGLSEPQVLEISIEASAERAGDAVIMLAPVAAATPAMNFRRLISIILRSNSFEFIMKYSNVDVAAIDDTHMKQPAHFGRLLSSIADLLRVDDRRVSGNRD
ncbi:hypothetical protein [Neorhizobium sp. DT-125]|uniref:hypothetical protein n=1 Tax=Neorhizobium sp. DT-125 TaxID=3396163 RepID=UPI003F1B0506